MADPQDLETLVRKLINDGVDRIALNKTLGILNANDDACEEMGRLQNFWREISYREEVEAKLRDLSTMSPAELNAVRWFDECLDCRARAWRDLCEDFYVLDHVWLQAVPGVEGMLCIGCLEARLGRQLVRNDFQNPERQLLRGKFRWWDCLSLQRKLGREPTLADFSSIPPDYPFASARLVDRLMRHV
jgi:hypothetical protein